MRGAGCAGGGLRAPRRADYDAPADPGLAACLAVGFVAAAFPGIDMLLSLVSPIAYLTGHRGPTQSLLALWTALLAWLCAGFGRRRELLRPFFIICAAALGVHILADLIPVLGTMLPSLLSSRRLALSTTFIIDLWLAGIVVCALLASVPLPRRRLPALHAIERGAGEQCAWFHDLRFVVPGGERLPMRYGMCRADAQSPWQRFEQIGEGDRRPL